MKTVTALFLVGMLIIWTELPTGSTWSCPPVRVTCARPNPPNKCYSNRQCPPNHKCCPSSCGLRCVSRLFFPSLSYNRVSGPHPASPTSLGSRGV